MKVRTFFCLAALSTAFAVAAAAADVTGKWVAQVPGREGQTRETTFNLKSAGETLTGSMSGPQGDIPISDGKVAGDDISFVVTLSFGGNEIKMSYKGKVAGDEIKFTRTREGGQGAGRPQEFTAKKMPT